MTTPYVTGTVSVTAGSAVVTGTGTGWQTSGLVAGQFGVDGLSVPVLSIDSNTKITLAQPWPGATASGKAYWISYDTTPGQQAVANAQRLAEYIARLDKPALAALASLVPAADKLPYFGAGGAGALADFNAAARALLAGGILTETQLPNRLRGAGGLLVSDYNSANQNGYYLTTPTSANGPPVPGFYVVQTQRFDNFIWQEAKSDVGNYYRFGQIGSVTPWLRQNPPERGSNANGEYVRFADGTQICFARRFLTANFQSRHWNSWSFPATFVSGSVPVVNHVANLNSIVDAGNNINLATSLFVASETDLNNTGVVMQITSGLGALLNFQQINLHAMAMGRWY